jgi:GDSL-like Lipase/Acylhydrolase family
MTSSDQQPSALTLSPLKRAFFTVTLVLLSVGLIEIGLRTVLAFKSGSRVFLYGTSYYRNTPVLPSVEGALEIEGTVNAHRKGDHEAVGATAQEIATPLGAYAKYFPNEPKIDFDEHGNRFAVAINEHGFRGKSFTRAKTPGTVRVVTLGASSTFGYYDRDDETYPYYLEQNLNAETPGSVEVLNLGIPHLTSGQILELFRAEVLPLAPDVVTFYEAINDSSEMPDATWQAKREEKTADSPLRRLRGTLGGLSTVRDAYVSARERLLLLALVDSLLLSDVITYNSQDVERHMEGKSERFLANISAIRDACRARGILFIVMTQQARSMGVADVKGVTYEEEIQVTREKLQTTSSVTHQEKVMLTHKMLMDGLRTWASTEGVPLVDIINVLDHDRDVLLSWVHVNPRGNRQIAHALSEKIREEMHKKALKPGPENVGWSATRSRPSVGR